MIDLRCPKDGAALRSYERSGITIERCSECGGVFLDRGELEKLIAQEGQFVGSAAGEQDAREQDAREREDRPGQRGRRGWLGDLLDFGD